MNSPKPAIPSLSDHCESFASSSDHSKAFLGFGVSTSSSLALSDSLVIGISCMSMSPGMSSESTIYVSRIVSLSSWCSKMNETDNYQYDATEDRAFP